MNKSISIIVLHKGRVSARWWINRVELTSACQRLATIVSFVRRPQPIAFILWLGGPGNEVTFLTIDTGGRELLYNTRLSHLLSCA